MKLPPAFALPSGGQKLPDDVRHAMEGHFRTDLSGVRVQVSPVATTIGALAFTCGDTVVFAPGQYNPSTPRGRQLLGHELAHVIQQRAGRVRNPFGTGTAVVRDAALEAEADRAGMMAATAAARPPPTTPTAKSKSPAPAAPGPRNAPVAQPVLAGLAWAGAGILGLGGLGGLGWVGKTRYQDGRLGGEPARIRQLIAAAPWPYVQNLSVQTVMNPPDGLVDYLAEHFVPTTAQYDDRAKTQFQRIMRYLELAPPQNWLRTLQTAYIACAADRFSLPFLSTLPPSSLEKQGKALIFEVLGLFRQADCNAQMSGAYASGAPQASTLIDNIHAALAFLGTDPNTLKRQRVSIITRVASGLWPFLGTSNDMVCWNKTRLAEMLFELYISRSDFRYNIGTSFTMALHDKIDPKSGNCIALASDLNLLFGLYGIIGTMEEVRKPQPGRRFIVYCPRFIDSQEKGNTYRRNQKLQNYYVFQNHVALKVGNTYYDPMAGAIYTQFETEAELKILDGYSEQDSVAVYTQIKGKALLRNNERAVFNFNAPSPTGFPRVDVLEVGAFSAALNGRVPKNRKPDPKQPVEK